LASLSQPPIQTPIPSNVWSIWFSQVWKALSGPLKMSIYTVASLPDATINEGGLIYVSNETGGAVAAFSDGTNWRRVTDRAVVS
jgi:hypothetical protein